jgi:nucleotide-binding universal stress UspA family protein
MIPFTSILVATDFSVDGNNAVRRAALLAHEHGTRLHILHVLNAAGCKPLRDWFSPTIDIDLKAAQARAALRRCAVEIAGAYDVSATVEVAVGDPFETLMQASEQAALVVLGQRGHNRLESLLIGRTADRMLRTCRRPVLVVKTAVERPYASVLLPVDFTSSSDAAVRFAALFVRDARVHVFHAADTHREAMLRRSDVDESVIRELRVRAEAVASARMRRKAAAFGLDGRRTSVAVGRGPAVQETLRHAAALGADLIVAGKQGRSTLGRFLLGSVSSRVLSSAGCDVLIVPRPREAASPAMRPQTEAPAVHAGTSSAANWTGNTPRFQPRRAS